MSLKRASKAEPTLYELLIPQLILWLVITLFVWWQVALVSLAALLLVWYLISRLTPPRRRWNERLQCGACLHYGYDLRASIGRCPECGNDPVVVKIDAPPEGL